MSKGTAKQPGRRRIIAGWALLALALVALAAEVASAWWGLSVCVGRTCWVVHDGVFAASVWTEQGIQTVGRTPVVYRRNLGSTWYWGYWSVGNPWAGTSYQNLAIAGVALPGWAAAVLLGGASGWTLTSGLNARRRSRPHLCRGCGYDKTGLAPGAVCPECGK